MPCIQGIVHEWISNLLSSSMHYFWSASSIRLRTGFAKIGSLTYLYCCLHSINQSIDCTTMVVGFNLEKCLRPFSPFIFLSSAISRRRSRAWVINNAIRWLFRAFFHRSRADIVLRITAIATETAGSWLTDTRWSNRMMDLLNDGPHKVPFVCLSLRQHSHAYFTWGCHKCLALFSTRRLLCMPQTSILLLQTGFRFVKSANHLIPVRFFISPTITILSNYR